MELVKLIVSIVGTVGAVATAAFGVYQYRRAQLWRRKEFIGAEVKSFLSSAEVRNALLMIDWSIRSVPFDRSLPRSEWPVVTREIQIGAFVLHKDKQPSGAGGRRYTELETEIRDAYDCFFDGVERLASFAEAGLYGAEELRPYVQYWVERVVSVGETGDVGRDWLLGFVAYVEFYRYVGVQAVFLALGYDIRPEGTIWRRLNPPVVSQ